MKRSWTTYLLILGLGGLLIALGALQYRWQTQIADNEGERVHRRVSDDASRFAADFNREVQNAYFNLQVEAIRWKRRDFRPFVERYEYWRSKAKYPALIRSVYFFEARADAAPMIYDASARTFAEADRNDELRDLHSRFGSDKDLRPIDAGTFNLVMPIYDEPEEMKPIILRRSSEPSKEDVQHLEAIHRPETFGYLVIGLDPDVIKKSILPDLAAQYFQDGEFDVAVTDKNGDSVFRTKEFTGEGDAQNALFDLAPGDFIYFANKKILSSLEDERRAGGVVVNEHFESRTNHVETSNGRTVKVEVSPGTKPRTSVLSGNGEQGGKWLLTAQHRDGSIAANLANTKRRNLGIAFGILGLLGAAVGVTIFSAQRAKLFAQRQVDFVSSVSHEFRTPLAVICSAGENLADGVAADKQQVSSYGKLIKGEGKKLSTMVEQILEFAGANSGKQRYRFDTTRVEDIVADAFEGCDPLLQSKSFNIETDIAGGLPAVFADRTAVSLALQNLIANAVKYGNGSRWLRVTASNGGANIRITVEDKGIGISAADLRHIFEPFYRAKEVVDAQIHGNGLGLALVQQVAEAHGGRVSAESEIGKGSVFTIEIPV